MSQKTKLRGSEASERAESRRVSLINLKIQKTLFSIPKNSKSFQLLELHNGGTSCYRCNKNVN